MLFWNSPKQSWSILKVSVGMYAENANLVMATAGWPEGSFYPTYLEGTSLVKKVKLIKYFSYVH